jgi:phage terminase large subunit-like protein
VWVVESEKKHGMPKSWADPLITQVCSFYGEGSIKHDDYVDSTTQALRLLADRNQISVTRKTDDNDKAQRRSPPSKAVNPYSA